MRSNSEGLPASARGSIAAGLFLLALWLRTSGLSHDLHHGKVYHPDTPKQVRAVERFLDGNYYTVIGGRDYEGYPLFNSHLTEYLVRSYELSARLISKHLGMSGEIGRPDYLTIFWITRALNAFLSACAVLLVFYTGWRHLSPATGIIGGILLAWSPADITACHFANGDTTAAFFALAGVAVSLELIKTPSRRFYLLAGLLAAAAFSSKYHGILSIAPPGLAHIFYFGKNHRLLSRESFSRMALLCASLAASIFITSPALLVHTKAAFNDILQFLEYTASFNMTDEMKAMSLWQRLGMGMSLNMPALLSVIGWVPALGSFAALWIYRRHPPVWLIACVPALYILAGLSTKPLSHPVYHTMATPYIMLLGGGFLAWLLGKKSRQLLHAWNVVGFVLMLVALYHLYRVSSRELFFFQHNDTRYLAESWARENVPEGFDIATGPYTFTAEAWQSGVKDAGRKALFFSQIRKPSRIPAESVPAMVLQPERDKLTPFRNPTQFAYFDAPGLISNGFRRPGYMPLASTLDRNLLPAGAQWFFHSPFVHHLARGGKKDGSIYSDDRLQRMWIVIQGGPGPSAVAFSVAGLKQTTSLVPFEQEIVEIEPSRTIRPYGSDACFYPYKLECLAGSATVHLITEPLNMAWILFNRGDYAAALQVFAAAGPDNPTGIEPVMAAICRMLTGKDASDITLGVESPSFFQRTGLAPAFFDALPGLRFEADQMQIVPVAIMPPPGVEEVNTSRIDDELKKIIRADGSHPDECYRQTSTIQLQPGHYMIRITRDNRFAAPSSVELIDHLDRVLQRNELTGMDDAFEFRYVNPDPAASIKVRIRGTRFSLQYVDAIELKPDLPSTVNDYHALLMALKSRDYRNHPLTSLSYFPLLSAADQHAANDQQELALQAIEMAISLIPERREAYQKLAQLVGGGLIDQAATHGMLTPYEVSAPAREVHPVDVTLKNNMRLTGFQISTNRVEAGGSFGISLFWEAPQPLRSSIKPDIWIHAIREDEKKPAFYGNILMATAERMLAMDGWLNPYLATIDVPKEVTPGKYQIKTGLWIASQRRNIGVADSKQPADRRGAFITTIEVY